MNVITEYIEHKIENLNKNSNPSECWWRSETINALRNLDTSNMLESVNNELNRIKQKWPSGSESNILVRTKATSELIETLIYYFDHC